MGSVEEPALEYDVLIIGAGLAGIYALYRTQLHGLRVKVLEAGAGEGGTWFWNTYPGCRFDSESYSYGFGFSEEVLQEWSWTEHFAPQPETLKYLQYVTDKFDLRKDIKFNTTVKSAHWQSEQRLWLLIDANGMQYTTRFLITAMGILSQPSLPNIPGVETFRGEAWHPARWPKDWSLDGKRVGVIGTGATAIQLIPEIAKTNLKHLTVFQRRANWSAPLRNDKISRQEMVEIKKNYPQIMKQYNGGTRQRTHRPREKMYNLRGFSKWLGGFNDLHTDREAATAYSDFIANKIRGRVGDPATAERLIPKCHLFGTKRVPLESGYFETFNKPNVRLVDYKTDSAIERINEMGVKLESGEEIELDVLIYATGFDALTGALTNGIDLRGIDGMTPSELWKDGICTYLGLFLKEFPNLCGIGIPHQAFGNVPRSLEFAVEWVSTFLKHCQDNKIT